MRSMIHDLANTLSGIQGILELSSPLHPVSPRDRTRMEAILEDGMILLERSRHLVLGSFPEAVHEHGPDWRHQLTQQFKPLSVIFGCELAISHEGDSVHDRWPGELLRGYVLAVSRQILPYVQGSTLNLHCRANQNEWCLRWSPVAHLPESLQPGPGTRPRDISARWAVTIGSSLAAALAAQNECIIATVPRF